MQDDHLNEHQKDLQVNEEPKGIAPWLSVWTRPRDTIRQFLNSSNPTKHMIVIAMLSGVISSLNQASTKNQLDEMSWISLTIIIILAGMVGGIISLYLCSIILRWTGSWFGGTGTSVDMRVALTRGVNVVLILAGVIWIPELLLFGKEMFTADTPRIDDSAVLSGLLVFFSLIEVVLGIWGCIIGLKAIGEAHQFSAWKALWSVVVPVIILIFILVFLGIVLSIAF